MLLLSKSALNTVDSTLCGLAHTVTYPIFLRCIWYTSLHMLPENEYFAHHRHTLRFLLDYPRRCYTNLFPSRHTWWLLCAVLVLNGLDWAAFGVLNVRPNVSAYTHRR